MEQRVNTLTEKVARMEAQLEAQNARLLEAHSDREELKAALAESNKSLQVLLLKISKWEGKFGGVIFILGCLTAFFSGLLTFIKNWVTTFGVLGK